MKKYIWLIPLILFSLISLFGDYINGRFDLVDFEVYFRTAERMLEGAEIYRIDSDGHFVYKYAPSAALYFLPFLPLGFAISKVLFWLVLTAALAWGLSVLAHLIGAEKADKTINITLFFSILAVVPHIHLEWHLGQVNMLLMVLFVASMKAYLENQQKTLGILLGASLFVKPFALIFLPYLLFKKRFSALAYTIVATLIIGFLPFVFYPSWPAFTGLYISWITELQIEMSSKQALFADANHTIFSVLARYTPFQYTLIDNLYQKIYQLIILGIMGLAFLKYMQLGKGKPKAAIGELAMLTAWIPILAFTSQNAFIYTLPLIVYLLFNFSELAAWAKALLVLGCFLIGINMHDIVGDKLYWALMQGSIYTFGSMMLMVVAFYLRIRNSSTSSPRN
jgi:hypothetical protein